MKRPNAFGLHDMHGNVWEWVEDNWYDNHTSSNPLSDRPRCRVPSSVPIWECAFVHTEAQRVVRGGAHFDPAYLCRSAARDGKGQMVRRHDLGFRVVFKLDWWMIGWYYREFGGSYSTLTEWDPDDQEYWTDGVVEPDSALAQSNTAYVVTGNGADAAHYSHFREPFGDVIFSADVRKTSGDSLSQAVAYGLYLRSDGTGRDYYELAIVVDGYFKIGKSVNGQYDTLVPWTPSSALQTGYGVWNRLKGVAIADTVQFYANGDFLHAIQDPAFDRGQVGLFAVDASASTAPDTVQFDNVEIVFDQSQATTATKAYLPYVGTSSPTQPTGWIPLAEETFEGSFPGDWEVFDDVSGNGEYHWARRGCRAYSGSYSGWAVGGGSEGRELSCGSNYPDSAESWMVYGPFSLADSTAADLAFKLWMKTEESYDWVFRGASTNGENYSGYRSWGNSGGWIDKTLDLSDVPGLGDLTGEPRVWVALIFASDGSVNRAEGAHIDNVVLRKYVPGAQAALPEPLSPR